MKIKKSGIVLAGAAAALLASGFSMAASPEPAAEGKVKCHGINACKGKSACKSTKHACKAMNTCKGQGWEFTETAEACTEKKGTVMMDETPKQ